MKPENQEESHVEHAEKSTQTVNQAQFKTQDPGAVRQWYLLCHNGTLQRNYKNAE